jgi:uncharacterized protein
VAINRQVLFLDTAYVNALINTRDQWHQTALRWERRLATDRTPLVTTEFMLVEIADGLAVVRFRAQAAAALSALRASRLVEIIPASSDLFTAGLRLYQSRPDKDWGLTDRTSFVAMGEHGLSEALTTDEHFRQAGFCELLLEENSK